MFRTIKVSIAAVLTTLAFGAAPVLASGGAHLSMSPSSGSYTVGNTFTITIHETSADPVNVVEPGFSFNQSLLQFLGLSCNAAAFEFTAPGNCGTASPKTGAQVVGTASFKVLAAGSAAVSFANSSHVYSSSNVDVWDGDATGASYNFVAPAPAPAPKKTKVLAATAPAPTPAPAPVVEVAPTPAPEETKPVETDVTLPAAPKQKSRWLQVLGGLALIALVTAAAMNRQKLMAAAAAARAKVMPAAAIATTAAAKSGTNTKPASKKKSPSKKK